MTEKLTRRSLMTTAAGTAAAALAMPHIANAQAQSVTVTSYGGAYEKFFREQLIPGFEKETGGKVALQIGTAKDNIPLFRAAGVANPPVDVCMTNEVIADILRGEGYFDALPADKVTNLKDVVPLARYPNDMAVMGWVQPIGLAYRSDAIKTAPTSWKDLWTRPDFKGKIGMYNITNSLGFMFVLMMARVFGGSEADTDTALKEIAKLKPFNQLDFSGTMEVQLSRSEVIVGPLDFAAVIRLQKRGIPLEGAVMDEGMVMFDQVFNVAKGSKRKDLAYAWVNYILSPAVQAKLVSGFYASPTNRTTEIPADLAKLPIMIYGDKLSKVVRFDWTAANAKRDVLVERWNREMS